MLQLKKKHKVLLLVLIFVLFFSFTNIISAREDSESEGPADPLELLNSAAGKEGAGFSTLLPGSEEAEVAVVMFAGQILGYLLSFLGAFFLLIIIYAGFLWMTASGNEEQITKAKNLIKNGFIGLIIIFGAGLIATFIYYLFASLPL